MQQYYIAINNQARGPYEVQELLPNGLTPTTLVWAQGMSGWQEAQSVPELAALLFGSQHTTVNVDVNDDGRATIKETYTQTTPPPFNPYASMGGGSGYPLCPKTWLVESVLVTVFCCLPFGVVGIVKAAQVESLWRQGRFVEAQAASQSAGTWTKIGFFTGLLSYLIYGSLVGVGLFASLL